MRALISTCCVPAGTGTNPTRWVAWHESHDNIPVLNIDGGSIIDSSGFLGISECLHAELQAILKGLELAWSCGIRRLVCHTDSLMVFRLLAQPVGYAHTYATIIEVVLVREKLQMEWEVALQHNLREGNECADFMAKMGNQQEDCGLNLRRDWGGSSMRIPF